jgi:hypothetical protein
MPCFGALLVNWKGGRQNGVSLLGAGVVIDEELVMEKNLCSKEC